MFLDRQDQHQKCQFFLNKPIHFYVPNKNDAGRNSNWGNGKLDKTDYKDHMEE